MNLWFVRMKFQNVIFQLVVGAEVAQYTAMHYPTFIKNSERYKEGKLSAALEETFLSFDALLTQDKVIQELKEIAGVNIDEDEEAGEKGTVSYSLSNSHIILIII